MSTPLIDKDTWIYDIPSSGYVQHFVLVPSQLVHVYVKVSGLEDVAMGELAICEVQKSGAHSEAQVICALDTKTKTYCCPEFELPVQRLIILKSVGPLAIQVVIKANLENKSPFTEKDEAAVQSMLDGKISEFDEPHAKRSPNQLIDDGASTSQTQSCEDGTAKFSIGDAKGKPDANIVQKPTNENSVSVNLESRKTRSQSKPRNSELEPTTEANPSQIGSKAERTKRPRKSRVVNSSPDPDSAVASEEEGNPKKSKRRRSPSPDSGSGSVSDSYSESDLDSTYELEKAKHTKKRRTVQGAEWSQGTSNERLKEKKIKTKKSRKGKTEDRETRPLREKAAVAKSISVVNLHTACTVESIISPSNSSTRQLAIINLRDGDRSRGYVTATSILKLEFICILVDLTRNIAATPHNEPATVNMGSSSMPIGVRQGLMGMSPGGRRLVFVPPEFGYGAQSNIPNIPPHSTLLFCCTLIDISSNIGMAKDSSMSQS